MLPAAGEARGPTCSAGHRDRATPVVRELAGSAPATNVLVMLPTSHRRIGAHRLARVHVGEPARAHPHAPAGHRHRGSGAGDAAARDARDRACAATAPPPEADAGPASHPVPSRTGATASAHRIRSQPAQPGPQAAATLKASVSRIDPNRRPVDDAARTTGAFWPVGAVGADCPCVPQSGSWTWLPEVPRRIDGDVPGGEVADVQLGALGVRGLRRDADGVGRRVRGRRDRRGPAPPCDRIDVVFPARIHGAGVAGSRA